MNTAASEMTAWSFRLPADLLERFKVAAAAEQRTAAGELRHLMEERVAAFESADRIPATTGEAAA
jgi:hypothetical protein